MDRRACGRCLAELGVVLSVVAACQREPTAEQVVARAADAMRGTVTIDAVQTLRVQTRYTDHDHPVISEFSRPNTLRTQGADYVLVFDGERGAFLERPPAEDGTPQGPEVLDAELLGDLELDVAFVFPAFFDRPSEYLGRELIDGVETYALRVVLPRGVPLVYYLDTQTYLPLRVLATVTMDGVEYRPFRVYRDYHDAGGIVYPRSFTVSWVPDNVDTATVERVEVNVPFEADRFAIPADVR